MCKIHNFTGKYKKFQRKIEEKPENSSLKRKKFEDPNKKVDPLEELPMKVPFKIVDGKKIIKM